jgi:ATP-dependent RNA helicase DeaD
VQASVLAEAVGTAWPAIVFCRTRHGSDRLARQLDKAGIRTAAIHGGRSQSQRTRALSDFINGKVHALVATDVAARGIDVMNLTHVVNYSLPQDAESYVHRIGRTGRAGKEGTAVTFVSGSEHARLMNFRRVINTEIQRAKLPKTKEIIQAKKHAVEEKLQALLSLEPEAKYLQWALELLEDNEPVQVVSALLKQGFHDALTVPKYDEIHEGRPAEERSGKRGKKVRLFVALGRKDQINPKKLVALIRSKSAIKSQMISDIKVMDNFSFLTVPHDKADKIVGHFKSKGQKPLVTLAKK